MAVSYFNLRMKALGIDKGQEFTELPDPNKLGGTRRAYLFSENKFGDIEIHYYRLNGSAYSYRPDENKWPINYVRRRLKNPLDGGEIKYLSPKGQGLLPYFTPGVIEKYTKHQTIETLFFIEGEFKAYSAYKLGADVVGMGSIHGFYGDNSADGQSKLHVLQPDIVDLLKRCNVKNIVILTDADTLAIKWKYDKDLYQRQNSFRKAIVNFYKVTQYFVDEKEFALESVYFGHLKTKYNPKSKGLDDLIENESDKKNRILNELLSLNTNEEETSFFQFQKLDANYYTELERYFGLKNVNDFYAKYAAYIGKKQFVFKNAKYVNPGGGTDIDFIYHKDVENFFRIGTDWMKRIKVPNKFGGTDEKIVPFSISEINRDYPDSQYPNFVYRIKKYDAYCNEPDWSDYYSREHYGCYNLANPISHRVKPGEFKNTLGFLKHLFGGQGTLKHYKIGNVNFEIECVGEGDQFTVALDWLTIFYKHPKQMLPVPILVSKEYGTGKSTFLKWLKAIYGTNVAILNNEQFKMRFNAHYITKMIIGIDESFLDVDKKAEKERLKQMVTSDTAYVEHKGVNLQEFPYYGKVVLCSNDADSVMKMDDQENRWFVVKVPKIEEKDKDPDLELKMKDEIPAFLNFLKNRSVIHPRKSRLWFEEKHFITEQFLEIVKNTKTRVEKSIDELIADMFITYNLTTLKLPRKWIVDKLNQISKYKTDEQDVKKYLHEVKKMKLEGPSTIEIPIAYTVSANNDFIEIEYDKVVQRYYTFNREDWVEEKIEDSKLHEQRLIGSNGKILNQKSNPNNDDDLPF